MKIFAEIDADQVFHSQLHHAKAQIESFDEFFLSQVEDETHSLKILTQVRIEPLHFLFEDAYISTYERMIPAEHHSGHRFFVQPGKSYPMQVIKYHLPFEGDPGLLRFVPNPRIMWTIEVELNGNEIAFDIINWGNNPEDVKREADDIFKTIREQNENLRKQVDTFNTNAQSQIVNMLKSRREKLRKNSEFVSALGLPVKNAGVSSASKNIAQSGTKKSKKEPASDMSFSGPWDVFISHASEDKEAFVRDLANSLSSSGLRVWYDEFTLTIGDSLRRSIDHGLSNSRFGIVVLSESFFSKEWPQRELDGLVAMEISSGKIILPIWHKVTKEDVTAFSPILADKLAVSSERGIEIVTKEVVAAINKNSG